MFGIDAILLSWLLVPLAHRVGDDMVDFAYKWLKAQGVTLTAALAEKIEAGEATPQELKEGIVEFGKEEPQEAKRLKAVALEEARDGANTPEELVRVMLSVLMAVVDSVKQLETKIVVVRGSLTGASDISVIDVRTAREDEELRDLVVSTHGPDAPRIDLARKGLLPTPDGKPSLWVLGPGDSDAQRIRELAEGAGEHFNWQGDFEQFMKSRPLVSKITARNVVLAATEVSLGGFSVKRGATPDPEPLTSGGLIAMFDQVKGALEDQERRISADRRRLKEALGSTSEASDE